MSLSTCPSCQLQLKAFEPALLTPANLNASSECWERYNQTLQKHFRADSLLLLGSAYQSQHPVSSETGIHLTATQLVCLYCYFEWQWPAKRIHNSLFQINSRLNGDTLFVKPDQITTTIDDAYRSDVEGYALSCFNDYRSQHQLIRAWAESALN